MRAQEVKEIRRKMSEVKAGFQVKDDPWKLVEQLLDENERLENKIESAYVGFHDGGF